MPIEYGVERDPEDTSILNLRAGELVEVRSREEILRSLDGEGKLEALPFMPEMLEYCGKQLRVFKQAHKTCDTIDKSGGRRMTQAVHLEGIRCDGSAHGGCQAGCLIFWKEAWLRREGHASLISLKNTRSTRSSGENLFQMGASGCSQGALIRATVNHSDSDNETYACQATELLKATSPLKWYDMRQYVRDIRSGNVHLRDALSAIWLRVYRKAIQIKGGGRLRTYYLLIYLYDTFQRLRGGTPYPWKQGKVEGATPSMLLNLRPGELVEVKTHEEILETINHRNRNRGLSFDAEMVPYCGRKYRVLRRVEKIIDEKTGKMIRLPNDCIVLDGVTCTAQFIPQRLFCPRSIYPYWREIWLKRVE